MSAPTDLELMMLLDGELDAERRAEVEAYLAEAGEGEGAAARGKLGGMRAVSRVVSSFEWPAGKSVSPGQLDIADLVMAALPGASVDGGKSKPSEQQTANAPASPAQTPSKASPKKPASETPLPVSSRKPANDNSRAIFGFAIAAAAAAAALFFWGKTGDDPEVGKPDRVAMTAPPPGSVAPIFGLEPEDAVIGVTPEVAKRDTDEPRYGVEVATVDFGARSGAIYYVPAADLDSVDQDRAAEKAVTTVVWLNDD